MNQFSIREGHKQRVRRKIADMSSPVVRTVKMRPENEKDEKES